MKTNVENTTYFTLIGLFSAYLVWVWGIGMPDYGAPLEVLRAELRQNQEPLLIGWDSWMRIYNLKKLALIICLIALVFRHSIGRLLLLLYSTVHILILHIPGWYVSSTLVMDVEWFIHTIQGVILGIAFFGTTSNEFTWSLRRAASLTRRVNTPPQAAVGRS